MRGDLLIRFYVGKRLAGNGMKEPLDHIERPLLPWRTGPILTECGITAVHVRAVTRSDFKRRLKEWGKARTAMTTCMTCYETASRWVDWNENPLQAMAREIHWEGHWTRDRGKQLHDELRSIAMLIDAHKDEFAELIRKVQGVADLSAVRRKRRGMHLVD